MAEPVEACMESIWRFARMPYAKRFSWTPDPTRKDSKFSERLSIVPLQRTCKVFVTHTCNLRIHTQTKNSDRLYESQKTNLLIWKFTEKIHRNSLALQKLLHQVHEKLLNVLQRLRISKKGCWLPGKAVDFLESLGILKWSSPLISRKKGSLRGREQV